MERLDGLYLKDGKNSGHLRVIDSSAWDIDSSSRLSRVQSLLGGPIVPISFYKNQALEDHHLYIKIKRLNNVSWLILSEKGRTWMLSQDGLPLRLAGKYGHGISFTWSGALLKTIRDFDAVWEAEINYNTAEAPTLRVSSSGKGFNLIPPGIKLVSVAQAGHKTNYDFFYDGELLKEVKNKQSIKSIFIAEYEKLNGMRSSVSNTISLKSRTKAIVADPKRGVEVQEEDANAAYIINADINGDFLTDEIQFNFNEYKSESEKIISAIKYESDGSFEVRPNISRESLLNKLNGIEQRVTTKIRVKKDQSYQLTEDPSLTIRLNEKPIWSWEVNEVSKNKAGFQIHTFEIKLKALFIPRLIDIDHNGKSDLIFCSYDEELDKNIPDIANPTGKVEKQSSLAHLLYEYFNKGKSDLLFRKPSRSGFAYFQYVDTKKALDFFSQNKNIERGQHPNLSYWQKADTAQAFECNQNSLLGDFNQDGQIDFLTGNKISLIDSHGSGETIELSHEQYEALFHRPGSELRIHDFPVIVGDFDGDGKFELSEGLGTFVDPRTRELHLILPGRDNVFQRAPGLPLLKRVKSTYGGEKIIEYKYQNGAILVNKIITKPNDTSSSASVEIFTYEGERYHKELNYLLGFLKVSRQLLDYKNQNVGEITVKTFDGDDQAGPLFFFSRARKNGRILSTKSKTMVKKPWDKLVSYSYIDKEFPGGFSYSYLNKNEQYTLGNGSRAFIQKNTYENFVQGIPTKHIKTKEYGDRTEIIESNLSFNNYNYTLAPALNRVTNDSGVDIAPPTIFEIDENSDVISYSESGIVTKIDRDILGRITSWQNSRGEKKEFSYLANTNLIASTQDEGVLTKYEYTPILNLLSSNHRDGEQVITYDWSMDGVLLSVAADGNNQFKVNDILEREIHATVLGQERTIKLNGFGELAEELNFSQGQWIVSSSQEFDFKGRVSKYYDPFYKNKNPNSYTLKEYDSLDRPLEEIVNHFDLEVKALTSYTYSNEGFKEISNILGETKRIWQNSAGDIIKTEIPHESAEFTLGSMGRIDEIRPFGFQYGHNLQGQIVRTESLNDWDSEERTFTQQDGLVSYLDGRVERLDYKDRPTYFSNGKHGTEKTEIERFYKLGRLSEDQTKIGNKIFNTHTAYGPNGKPVTITTQLNGADLVSTDYSYDSYNRIQQESTRNKGIETILNYDYRDGLVSAVKPYVKEVRYDEAGRISLVLFNNGVRLFRKYEFDHKLAVEGLSLPNGKSFMTKYIYNRARRLVEQESNFLDSRKFEYNENLTLMVGPNLDPNSISRHHGKALTANENNFLYNNNDLVSHINQRDGQVIHLHHGFQGEFLAACEEEHGECLLKLNGSHVIRGNRSFQILELANVWLGIIVDGNFYIAIKDHRGSILGLLSQKGDGFIFLRHFDPWGKLLKVDGYEKFSNEIPWSYGQLIQVGNKGQQLISNTRVYLPDYGRWAEVDLATKWSPEKLRNHPGNWDSTLYASGDPVNYIDPSGYFYQLPSSIVGMGIGMTVGGISEALMSPNKGWSYAADIGKSMLVGGTTGFFAGLTSGASLITTIGVGAGLGAAGTAYRLSLDGKDLSTNSALAKMATSALLGGTTGGLSTLAPNVSEKFTSTGLGFIESFWGGSANAVIEKVDQIHTQQENYVERLNQISK